LENENFDIQAKKEYAQKKRKEEIAALQPLVNEEDEKKKAICRGLDPGRVKPICPLSWTSTCFLGGILIYV